MKDCIFCKIVKGEMDSYTIYEDELVKVFLDAFPISKGHALIIPKEHYEDIYEIPEKTIERVASVTKKMADKYKEILKPDGVNVLQANGRISGQTVFHYHMHLVPRYKEDGIDLWFHKYSRPNINLEEIFNIIKKGN